MALDLYAGPLCRYHALNWKTIGQQIAEAQGMPFVTMRQNDQDDLADPEEVTAVVQQWQNHLLGGLGQQGVQIQPWREEQEVEYFTDRPGWSGLFALALKGQSLYQPAAQIPTRIPSAEELQTNSVYEVSQSLDSPMCILSRAELWLPGDFEMMFETVTVTGHEVLATSVGELIGLLTDICNMWGQDPNSISEMPTDQPTDGSELESGALHGLAVFMRVARKAKMMGQPIILDY